MYYFYYNLEDREIYRYLKYNTHKRRYIDLYSGIGFSNNNNNIILQEKKLMVHALQRRFIGKIIPLGNESLIIGDFKYPFITSLCFFMLATYLLCVNIGLLSSSILTIYKIYATIVFLFIYCIIVCLFITGKIFYKNQENNVIELLQYKAKEYYKDENISFVYKC